MSLLTKNGKLITTSDGTSFNFNDLINQANEATGENDKTLNDAVGSLIDPYEDINDAINAKGVSGTFLPSEMAAAITAIPSGGADVDMGEVTPSSTVRTITLPTTKKRNYVVVYIDKSRTEILSTTPAHTNVNMTACAVGDVQMSGSTKIGGTAGSFSTVSGAWSTTNGFATFNAGNIVIGDTSATYNWGAGITYKYIAWGEG